MKFKFRLKWFKPKIRTPQQPTPQQQILKSLKSLAKSNPNQYLASTNPRPFKRYRQLSRHFGMGLKMVKTSAYNMLQLALKRLARWLGDGR